MSTKKTTILLYGRSGSGKSTQIGQLAEHVFKTLGKKTRLYTADRGGFDSIQPYINLGIIDAIEMGETNPFIFLQMATKGYVRSADGKGWELNAARNAEIGCYAFESLRAFAESLLAWSALRASQGVNIGGSGNVNLVETGDGQTVKIGGSNMAMYGIAQARMTEEVWSSQKLDAPYIIWTSSVSKDEDTTSVGKVLGPDVIGKALTTEVPRWFNLTLRLDVIPAQQGKAERHILYLGSHVDVNAGNAAALGNTRLPLDSPPLAKSAIEPASLVEALKLLDGGAVAATAVIKKRLGL